VARFRTVTTEFNTRDVERELSDADRAFDRSATSAQNWSRRVKRSADDAVPTKGRGRWKDAGADLGQEFSQNIGEGIGSGKNAITGAVDTVLGTLGGFLPALGPAGAVAGVGFLVAKTIADTITAQQKQIVQATSDAIDAAARRVLENADLPSIADIITTLTPEQKQALTNAGVSISEYATAIFEFQTNGNPGKLNAIKTALDGVITSNQNLAQSFDPYNSNDAQRRAYADALDTIQRAGDASAVINAGSDSVLRAAQAAAEFAGTIGKIPDKEWQRIREWRQMFGSTSAGSINLPTSTTRYGSPSGAGRSREP
jgi:hypothetical protein